MTTAPQPDVPFVYALKSLRFSDGSLVEISPGDIVVLVGPNNAGKSAALKEIVRQLDSEDGREKSCAVVKAADVEVSEDQDVLTAFLGQLDPVPSKPEQVGRMGNSMRTDTIANWRRQVERFHQNLRRGLRAFTTYHVDTENRLHITHPVSSIDFLYQQKSHPFHYLADDIDLESAISKVFRKAFGADLIVNRTAGTNVHLHVGPRPTGLDGYGISRQARQELAALPMLHTQGDGMRAFVGCLMWGTVADYKILLIDEPEAFLHPPQARLLGRTLVQRKKANAQLILATHSGDLLRGLLDTNPPNLRILRLVRDGAVNRITQIQPADVVKLWSDPLLRQTNLLDGLFHQATIVCEGDADCQFYSAIANAIDEASETKSVPDCLWVHGGGKGRMPALIAPLRTLGVPVRVIADFDLLRDALPLRAIFETLGGNWDAIESDWRVVQTAISAKKAQLATADLRADITGALSKVTGDTVPDSILDEIKTAARKASAWAYAKTAGESFVPVGAPFNAYKRINRVLQDVGLWIVPVGELECFCKSIGVHGPKWSEEVCKKDLATDSEVQNARDFVKAVMSSAASVTS